MPPLHFWFTGAALGSFLALIATVSSLGYAWYSAAANEQTKASSSAAEEREKARLKVIRDHLQTFYVRGGVLLNRQLVKGGPEAELQQYAQDYNAWAGETETWISSNLGNAAAARFADIGSGFNFHWDRAINPQHNMIINLLTKYRENLAKLIESNAWDAGEKK